MGDSSGIKSFHFITFARNNGMVNTKSRRLFLKGTIIGIVSFLFIVWNKLTLSHIRLRDQSNKTLPFNKNKKVSFENDYIVVNNEKTTTVFSAHCTHLGCKINKAEGGRFVCPCHGSEYDMEGKVVKGPAYKNLKNLSFRISEDGKSITVES